MKDPATWCPDKKRIATVLTLSLILLTITVTTVPTTPAQTTRSTQQQDPNHSNRSNSIRESAPATSTYWAKTYGGDNEDSAVAIQETSDGGYIVAGFTSSFGAGGGDFWVLKLDSDGSVTWQKAYGGDEWEEAYSVQLTSDGGYIVAGYTRSFGAGASDVWVLKLDSTGSMPWDESSGASTHETSVVGWDSGATVFTTLATFTDGSVTVQNTQVTPQDTHATVTVQGGAAVGGGGSGQGIIVIIMASGVVVTVMVGLVAAVLMEKKREVRNVVHEEGSLKDAK